MTSERYALPFISVNLLSRNDALSSIKRMRMRMPLQSGNPNLTRTETCGVCVIHLEQSKECLVNNTVRVTRNGVQIGHGGKRRHLPSLVQNDDRKECGFCAVRHS